jgi:hypothetical protein
MAKADESVTVRGRMNFEILEDDRVETTLVFKQTDSLDLIGRHEASPRTLHV